MRVLFTERAKKEWQSFEKQIQNQLSKKLAFYLSQKNPLNYAEKLRESKYGEYRFRIGEYRIIFDIKDNDLIILKIGNRKDIYK